MLLTPRGKAIASGFKLLNSALKLAINVCVSFSVPDIISLNASLNLLRTISGVDDLIASIPIILSLGSAYCTPSLLCTLSIYRFFAVQIPTSDIASLAITILFLYALCISKNLAYAFPIAGSKCSLHILSKNKTGLFGANCSTSGPKLTYKESVSIAIT